MKKLISAFLAAMLAAGSVCAFSAAEQGTLRGDVNGDGDITISDATEIQKHCANIIKLDGEALAAADADGNGDVSVSDATRVQRIISNIYSETQRVLSDEEVITAGNDAVNSFAAKLLKANSTEGENTLVSPVSVMYALSMAANGANGKTLSEMEKTLGMSVDSLNRYFKNYTQRYVNNGEPIVENGYWDEEVYPGQTSIANSLWYNTSANMPQISDNYIDAVKSSYDAEVYPTAFDDAAVSSINGWVNDKTHKMIPHIVDTLDPNMLMCIINAVAFEGDWRKPYDPDFNVSKRVFHAANGSEINTDFMFSEEGSYIHDGDLAEGFIKYYEGYDFGFALLLPKEDIKLEDYVNSLTGDRISSALSEVTYKNLVTAMPKFEHEFSAELKPSLTAMGTSSAFDPFEADFTKMLASPAQASPFISSVIHKTYISVNESGTRAGAVTAIMVEAGAAPGEEPTPKYIIADRPFVYMIVNTSTHTPLFIGTVNTI